MRKAIGLMLVMCIGAALPAAADEDSDQVVGGILSGILGQPQNQSAAYQTQERERLIQLLSSGDYATSRQGETIDEWVMGIPLTHRDHVYSAKPAKPTQVYRPAR